MKMRTLVAAVLGIAAVAVAQGPASATPSTSAVTAASATSASALNCVGKDVVFVGARGIGEAPQSVGWNSSDPNGNLGPMLSSLFGVLQQRFPAVHFGSEGVDYRPVPSSVWSSPPSVSTLVSSANSGAQSFVGLIRATITACPNVRMIVAGYSEGAWLLHQALNALAPADLGHIVAVAAYGDPGYDPTARYGYGPATSPSWPGVGTALDRAHSSFPASLLPVTADVCRVGDPICHTSLNNPSWLKAVAACATAVKTNRPQLCPDFNYDATNATNNTATATFIGKHLPSSSPQVTTTGLNDGVAGLAFLQQVTASGGLAPYTFTAAGLPNGLTMSPHGVISGTPTATGTAPVTLTVTDANSTTGSAMLPLAVTQSLPASCINQACALLTPDGQTAQISAAQTGGIIRDPTTGLATQATLIGLTPTTGQVLVFAPSNAISSGLIAVADTITPNGDGTTTVTLTPAGPADAYADGTLKTIGTPITTTAAVSPAVSQKLASAAAAPPDPSPLSCTGGVTSELHGLGVTPSLTPTIAAIWAHPFFGGGGIYVGTGGLSLFQFDLDGTFTVNLGVTVSGDSTCTLTLPTAKAAVPAGELGAVVLSLTPKLTLQVTGKVDLRTSVTLVCGTEYRWFKGAQSRSSYCEPKYSPLALSSDTGVDATLSAVMDASVTLDDIVGITGTLSTALHAGYHPATQPVVEVDTTVDYELGACLACFWDDTPAKVTLASGTLFHAVLFSSGTPPPPVPGPPLLSGAVNVSTNGFGTFCSVLASGGVDCWGDNQWGQLGAGLSPFTANYSDVPVGVVGISQATSVSANDSDFCAVLSSGGVECWGANDTGELGAGLDPATTDYSSVPVAVSGIASATSVSADGIGTFCALLRGGGVSCWGDNNAGDNAAGQLGAGLDPTTTGYSDVPVRVVGITNAAGVSVDGDGEFCAVLNSRDVDCWGDNTSGRLGAGLDPTTTPYSDVPVRVVGITDASRVTINGFYTVCAVLTNGHVDCWGDDDQAH